VPNFSDENITRALYHYTKNKTVTNGVITVGDVVTYGREFWGDFSVFNTRKDWLTGYGLDNNAAVLVIGCGFGYLLEYLIDAGIDDVWGIDPGSFYWDVTQDTEWRSDVKPKIVNDWVGSGTEKASLNAAGVGGAARFTFVVDEDAAPMHSDAELPVFIAGCEARLQGNARGRIIHLVTTGTVGDSSVNWKSLADWKAVAPDHTWVDIGTGEVG
jgi:hypothetical protein